MGSAASPTSQPAPPQTIRAAKTIVRGDYARLTDDIPRAVSKAHWGLERMTPSSFPKDAQGHEMLVPINMRALLPDGREAYVRAEPAGEGEISVAVAVGRTGDAQAERAFVDVLQKVLAGKPKPKRGGKFEIPDWTATRPSGE